MSAFEIVGCALAVVIIFGAFWWAFRKEPQAGGTQPNRRNAEVSLLTDHTTQSPAENGEDRLRSQRSVDSSTASSCAGRIG